MAAHSHPDVETNRRRPEEAGSEHPEYDTWSIDELRRAARDAGIEGADDLPKGELIEQLRNR